MGKDMDEIAKRMRKKVAHDTKSGILGKITHYIPIYHGYKEKEERRESDKVLRDFLAKTLDEIGDDLATLQEMVVQYNLTNTWETFENIMALQDKITSMIKHADYGYASWGSSQKIDNKELDRMMEFDASLIEDLANINEVVEEFKDEMSQGHFDKAWEYTFKIYTILQRLERKWDQRKAFMMKYLD